MTAPEISGIAPLFIASNVPATLEFYRDRLGFDITFQGPEPDDIFFGIVQRGAAMIMCKDVGVDPVPNCTRDVTKGLARWDAYIYVPDPDALAAEFSARSVEFYEPLKDTDDGLRGFELNDGDGYDEAARRISWCCWAGKRGFGRNLEWEDIDLQAPLESTRFLAIFWQRVVCFTPEAEASWSLRSSTTLWVE